MLGQKEIYKEISESARKAFSKYKAVPTTPVEWWKKVGQYRYRGCSTSYRDLILELVHEIWLCASRDHRRTNDSKQCTCRNPEHGFDCVCDWVREHPGTINYTCEYCGIYSASAPKCNKCVKS